MPCYTALAPHNEGLCACVFTLRTNPHRAIQFGAEGVGQGVRRAPVGAAALGQALHARVEGGLEEERTAAGVDRVCEKNEGSEL